MLNLTLSSDCPSRVDAMVLSTGEGKEVGGERKRIQGLIYIHIIQTP